MILRPANEPRIGGRQQQEISCARTLGLEALAHSGSDRHPPREYQPLPEGGRNRGTGRRPSRRIKTNLPHSHLVPLEHFKCCAVRKADPNVSVALELRDQFNRPKKNRTKCPDVESELNWSAKLSAWPSQQDLPGPIRTSRGSVRLATSASRKDGSRVNLTSGARITHVS